MSQVDDLGKNAKDASQMTEALEKGLASTAKSASKLTDVLEKNAKRFGTDTDAASRFSNELQTVASDLRGVTEGAADANKSLLKMGGGVSKTAGATKDATEEGDNYLSFLNDFSVEAFAAAGIQKVLAFGLNKYANAARDVNSLGLPLEEARLNAALKEQLELWGHLEAGLIMKGRWGKTWGMDAAEMEQYLVQLQSHMRFTGVESATAIDRMAEVGLVMKQTFGQDLPKSIDVASRYVWRFGRGQRDVGNFEDQMVGLKDQYDELTAGLEKSGDMTLWADDYANMLLDIATTTDGWSMSMRAAGTVAAATFDELIRKSNNYNASVETMQTLMGQLDRPETWMRVETGMTYLNAYEADKKGFLEKAKAAGMSAGDTAEFERYMNDQSLSMEARASIAEEFLRQTTLGYQTQLAAYKKLLGPTLELGELAAIMPEFAARSQKQQADVFLLLKSGKLTDAAALMQAQDEAKLKEKGVPTKEVFTEEQIDASEKMSDLGGKDVAVTFWDALGEDIKAMTTPGALTEGALRLNPLFGAAMMGSDYLGGPTLEDVGKAATDLTGLDFFESWTSKDGWASTFGSPDASFSTDLEDRIGKVYDNMAEQDAVARGEGLQTELRTKSPLLNKYMEGERTGMFGFPSFAKERPASKGGSLQAPGDGERFKSTIKVNPGTGDATLTIKGFMDSMVNIQNMFDRIKKGNSA